MTDHDITDLLERTAERVQVGPAPVATMVGVAGRARRRRTAAGVVAAASAVVAVAVTSVVLSPPEAQPPVSSPAPATPPVGMRYVGIGHAAIAVPEEWGTNEIRCGTPQQDTVVIDISVFDACAARRPNGVDSVELSKAGRRFDFTADREVTIDGVAAERQATTCESWRSSEVCHGTVFIRSLNVSFRAESSTSAAEVDRILEQIRVLPDLVAVPGIESANFNLRGKGTTRYATTLDLAGLAAEVRTKNPPRLPAGYIIKVTPPVGTMVAPGTTVTVTVAR